MSVALRTKNRLKDPVCFLIRDIIDCSSLNFKEKGI